MGNIENPVLNSEPVHFTTWPRGYKTFFMLKLAEHENSSTNKYENAN